MLRILPPDDSKSQCQMGMKYGCHPKHAQHLLQVAKQLELNVVGVRYVLLFSSFVKTASVLLTLKQLASFAKRAVRDLARAVHECFHAVSIDAFVDGNLVSFAVSMSEVVAGMLPRSLQQSLCRALCLTLEKRKDFALTCWTSEAAFLANRRPRFPSRR